MCGGRMKKYTNRLLATCSISNSIVIVSSRVINVFFHLLNMLSEDSLFLELLKKVIGRSIY